MKPTEKALQKAILEYINLKGHYCWRNNSGMFFGKHKGKSWAVKVGMKGSSDIIGVSSDGRFIAIEVKIRPNKPTDEQVEFLREVASRGGISILAFDLSDVEKWL